MNAESANRHLAEERNQVDLRDSGKYEDEEARYGAVDRRNQKVVYGSKANKLANSKFKTFHATIDKNGLKNMTDSFVKRLCQKSTESSLATQGQISTNLKWKQPVQPVQNAFYGQQPFQV